MQNFAMCVRLQYRAIYCLAELSHDQSSFIYAKCTNYRGRSATLHAGRRLAPVTGVVFAESRYSPEKEKAEPSRHKGGNDAGDVSQPYERCGAPRPVIKQYSFIYLIKNAVHKQEQHNGVVKLAETRYEIRNYVKRRKQVDSRAEKRRADAQRNAPVAKQFWNHQSDAGDGQERFFDPALFYKINQMNGGSWNHILFSGK